MGHISPLWGAYFHFLASQRVNPYGAFIRLFHFLAPLYIKAPYGALIFIFYCRGMSTPNLRGAYRPYGRLFSFRSVAVCQSLTYGALIVPMGPLFSFSSVAVCRSITYGALIVPMGRLFPFSSDAVCQ